MYSNIEIMLTNTTPHFHNYRPEKVLWGNKYSFMFDQKNTSDFLLLLQVIKLALLPLSIKLPDLLTMMSLFSGETLPAYSCNSPPPSPQHLARESCSLTRVSKRFLSSRAAPEATSCNAGGFEPALGYSRGGTGDFCTLRECKAI